MTATEMIAVLDQLEGTAKQDKEKALQEKSDAHLEAGRADSRETVFRYAKNTMADVERMTAAGIDKDDAYMILILLSLQAMVNHGPLW